MEEQLRLVIQERRQMIGSEYDRKNGERMYLKDNSDRRDET